MKKLVVTAPKERNQFVAAALFRKAGSHRKSEKAQRAADKAALKRGGRDLCLH